MQEQLVLIIPAKINLSLDITGRRPDGYHTLRSVFQTIECFDTLTLTHTDAPLTLTCTEPGIPCDARNLVWKAAERLLGTAPHGLHMQLRKHIPSQAGMGGGSADCAAALLGIRALLRPELTDEELLMHASALGADVPFFLMGGTVLAEGIGEQLTPLPECPVRTVLMAKGSEGVSTPAGYRALDACPVPPPHATDSVLAHLQDSDPSALFAACGNAFDAVTDLPEIRTIRQVMRRHGIIPVLSGSGAAVFGGCTDSVQAEACASALRGEGISFTEICRTTAAGIRIQTPVGAIPIGIRRCIRT